MFRQNRLLDVVLLLLSSRLVRQQTPYLASVAGFTVVDFTFHPSTHQRSTSFLLRHQGQRQIQSRHQTAPPVTDAVRIIMMKNSPVYEDTEDRLDGYYPSQYLINIDREKLAFDELYIARSNQLVMYLPNLGEGRDNPTSDSVLKFCIRRERNFLVADWFGRGDSTGKLMSATLTRWKQDVITLLDNVPTHVKASQSGMADFKKAVLVGNGVGVWVAVLVALERPDLVRGIVGIGGDPDFTEELLWAQLPQEEKDAIMRDGFREIQWGTQKEVYPITSSLILDGRDNLVLRGGKNSLNIKCPVRLIHNLEDKEVPAELSVRLAECINSPDVVVNMPKFGTLGVTEAIDQCFAASSGTYVQ